MTVPLVSYTTCPNNNHPHLIDLGLPSGTKWACCNVGATTPEGYGGYYAWGETEVKTTYDWSTYIYYDGTEGTCQDLGSDIVGTEYDVAHVKWGSSWVMPTRTQQDELRENCNYEWTKVNGINGYKFTSNNNGASIFLPAAGYHPEGNLYDVGSAGNYWTSTQDSSDPYSTYYLNFYSDDVDCGSNYRYYGLSVRPVSQ